MRTLGLTVGWAMSAGAAIVLATQLFGTPTAVIAALQSLSPWALPPITAVAVIASVRQEHRLCLVASLVGVGYLALTAPIAFPDHGPSMDDDSAAFTVMASNILYSNDQIDRAGDVFLQRDADVIGLAEVTPAHLEELRSHPLADRYPYRIERVGPLARGLIIWSRFPLDEIATPPESERALAANVSTPDALITVVLVHPPPPVFHREVWERELDAIPIAAASTGFPTIVMGDFNATVFHPPFREAVAEAELFDAVPAAGHPLTMTWPTDEWMPAFVAIDHILLDDRLAIDDAGVVDVPGADHSAVWASVGLAASG